jgi:dUTP pyrophosphatase
MNFGQEDFLIQDGERIAQMVVSKYEKVDFLDVELLDETERGSGGFGHSGIK